MTKTRFELWLACLLTAALVLLPGRELQAQNIQLTEDHPDSYRVVEGDTLWDIAGTFLEQPWQWPGIWEANPQIENPDLIYPGDLIRLVYIDGQPRLVLERGERPVVRLSPRMRESARSSAIPAIPLEAINNSLVRNRIITQESYEAAPYVLASTTSNVIMGAGDEAYVRGERPGSVTEFEIFRLGPSYRDPVTDEVLGVEGLNMGLATVVSQESEDVARMAIRRSREEIKVGDRMLAREERRIDPTFFPTPPEQAMDGQVIALLNDERMAAQYNSVIINLGEREGLKVGDLLAIHESGRSVEDPVAGGSVELPAREIGLLMTYRTFEKLSYAVILTLTEPSRVGNAVRTP